MSRKKEFGVMQQINELWFINNLNDMPVVRSTALHAILSKNGVPIHRFDIVWRFAWNKDPIALFVFYSIEYQIA